MKKFEIRKDTVEFKNTRAGAGWTADEVVTEYLNDGNVDGRIICSVDTIEEASDAFENLVPSTHEFLASSGGMYVHGDIYILEENDYDDDDWIINSNWLEVKVAELKGEDDDE